MIENDKLPVHETNELSMAAFLIIKGFVCKKIEIRDKGSKHGTFVFENVPRKLIIDFNQGNCLVEPMILARTMNKLFHNTKNLSSFI